MTDSKSPEHQIQEDHRILVSEGFETESNANESDAFARRVIGLDKHDDEEDYSGPNFKNGRCTRCKRTKDYCEC